MWADGVVLAQHHVDPGGALEVGGLWVRLLTMVALVVVAAIALLRPFAGDRGTRGDRSRTVAVVAAFVAVVGVLVLAPVGGRGSTAAVLPVVLVTTALAMLPVIDTSRRGRLPGYSAGSVGVLALVFGTEPAAVGQLLSGDWSGTALLAGVPVWLGALAWLALATPPPPVGIRVVWAVGFVVATGVVAAVPGFIAVSGDAATAAAGALPLATPATQAKFH